MRWFSPRHILLAMGLYATVTPPTVAGDGGDCGNDRIGVRIDTDRGTILAELDRGAAPATVENFLAYARDNFFAGTIFHRVIRDFMIQGGGMTADMDRKRTRAPVRNESTNGLSNTRGTLAMARTNDPDSATSQFFINLVDNNHLDGRDGRPGYTVFGRVTNGMEVVDEIAAVQTTSRSGHRDVPREPITITGVSTDTAGCAGDAGKDEP